MLRLQAISTESLDPHCLGAFEFVEREKNQEKKESYCYLIKIQMSPMFQEVKMIQNIVPGIFGDRKIMR